MHGHKQAEKFGLGWWWLDYDNDDHDDNDDKDLYHNIGYTRDDPHWNALSIIQPLSYF